MSTITGTVTIEDPIGFHARPAGQIVKLVKESGLEVRMGKAGGNLVKSSPTASNSCQALRGLGRRTGKAPHRS